MEKTIIYNDETNDTNNEISIINNLSKSYEDIENYLPQIINSTENYKELVKLAKEYNSKLNEIKNARIEIINTKHAKDLVLNKIIELSQAPIYLDYKIFNYKSLVLYFMNNFRDNTMIHFNYLRTNAEDSLSDINKLEMFFHDEKKRISVNTHLDTLLHLINIDKDKIKATEIIEKMIYGKLNYGEQIKSQEQFKSKIASIPWVKKTLLSPDYIYDKDNLTAVSLEADLLFIREVGNGTKTQPYIYHLLGLRYTGNFNYTLVSQFPIEKDRINSKDETISILHKYVNCNKAIYVKKGKEIPKYPNSFDKLKNKFGE